jgi:two-component system phosphate regulon sensor histidine kinase PhoR
MVYNSRVLALLLALCISIITTLFLSLVESVNIGALVVGWVISFSVSYILIFVVLEFLVFREINTIYRLLGKLKKKHLSDIEKQKPALLNPLKNINEEIYAFANVKQREIDELKKLEAFRKEFIADVSHELKTPIFAAQGFVHTLLDGAVNDKTVRDKFLRKAAKSLDGLDMLVQDLLTLSHIETGQIKMHFEKINLYELAQEVFEQFEGKPDRKAINLQIDSSSKNVTVYADWQRITQVMTNLISNAIKHSPDGSDVIVIFSSTKKYVVVKIKDFGEGIPAQDIGRIFERFYRVDKSRSREKGGTGLGLAIVKHILEGHNSKADVESTPGKGSVFSFKLPKEKPNKGEESEHAE